MTATLTADLGYLVGLCLLFSFIVAVTGYVVSRMRGRQ